MSFNDCCLLVQMLPDDTNVSHFHMTTIDSTQFTKLDAAAVLSTSIFAILSLLSFPDRLFRYVCIFFVIYFMPNAYLRILMFIEILTTLFKFDQEELKKLPDFSRTVKKFQKQLANIQVYSIYCIMYKIFFENWRKENFQCGGK